MFGILRTILAFNVVLLHVFSVPILGNYSVMAFFVLSGFLMTLIMQNKYGYTIRGFKFFWFNRFLRLYPVYWSILLISVVLLFLDLKIPMHPAMKIPVGFSQWFSNLTMVFTDMFPHKFDSRVVPPAWALTNELFYYTLISIGVSRTMKRTIIWFILGVLYFFYTYLFKDLPTYRYGFILASSLPFSFGAMLFYGLKYFPLRNIKWYVPVLTYLLFIANGLFLNNKMIWKFNVGFYLNLLLSACLVYQLYFLFITKKWKRMDAYIGHFSYPIYLSHYICAVLFVTLFGHGNMVDSFKLESAVFIPYTLFLIIFCFILVKTIDLPFHRIKQRVK